MTPAIVRAPALLDATLATIPEGFMPLWHGGHRIGAVSPAWQGLLGSGPFTTEMRGGQRQGHLKDGGPALQRWAQAQKAAGMLPGWRNEAIEIFGPDPRGALFEVERALLRPLGLLLRTVQVNVYTLRQGVPWLWCARRAAHKPVDPGLMDSLVAGGIGVGETPLSTLFREAAEEAALPSHLSRRALPTGIMDSVHLAQEGEASVLHRERMHVFDLQVPEDFVPSHPDGETEHASLLSLDEVLAQIRNGLWTREGAWAGINLIDRWQRGDLRVR